MSDGMKNLPIKHGSRYVIIEPQYFVPAEEVVELVNREVIKQNGPLAHFKPNIVIEDGEFKGIRYGAPKPSKELMEESY